MLVIEKGEAPSRFVACLGLVLAIVAGSGCSSEDRPVDVGPTLDGGSDVQDGSTSGTVSADASLDAAGWVAACRAVTPPAPDCPCICRSCAQVTALCFGSTDCPPIVECVQRTACRSSAECLGACASQIAAHMAGVVLAQNFQSCFNPMCAALCILPDASTDARDGARETATDASSEPSADVSTIDVSSAPSTDVSTVDATAEPSADVSTIDDSSEGSADVPATDDAGEASTDDDGASETGAD